MIKKNLMLGFLTLVLGLFPAIGNVQVEASEVSANLTSVSSETSVNARRFGPYATLRRANEVANYARSLGYNAKVIYWGSYVYGTRKYYVDVW